MASAKDWAKKKGAPHVVEEVMEWKNGTPSVIREHHFDSKKDAMEHGKKMRAAGKDVAVHAKDFPLRSANNPGVTVVKAGAGGDEIVRDEQGRFANH